MTELVVRSKKKKRILMKILNPNEEEIHQDLNLIVKKIFKIFQYHVGKENSISSYDLFMEIFGKYPDELDVFERTYLWNVMKMLFTKMRGNGELFIVNNGSSEYYVLKTEEECKMFKNRIDNVVKSLENVKKKADAWVKDKKWKTNLGME